MKIQRFMRHTSFTVIAGFACLAVAVPGSAPASGLTPEARAYRATVVTALADLRPLRAAMDRAERAVRFQLKACGPVADGAKPLSGKAAGRAAGRLIAMEFAWLTAARVQVASPVLEELAAAFEGLPVDGTLPGEMVLLGREYGAVLRQAPLMPPDVCAQIKTWNDGKFGRLPPGLAASASWITHEPDVPFDAKGVSDDWERLMRQHRLHPLRFVDRVVATRVRLSTDVLLRLFGVPARIRKQVLALPFGQDER